MRVYNIQKLKSRRQELRKNQTSTENILWEKLRREQLGYKFRRQHSVGGYILDFYCPKKKLIIEIDGPIHRFQKKDDSVRDKYFEDLGIVVLRFTNEEVEKNLEKVLAEIKNTLK